MEGVVEVGSFPMSGSDPALGSVPLDSAQTSPLFVPRQSSDPEPVGFAPDPLHAISYVSVPTVSFSDQEITDLLFAARRWNAQYKITGKLVVLEEGDRIVQFLQWIEGPPVALDACFERINADPRHGDLHVRFRGPVASRRFPAWDMAIDTATSTSFATEVDAFTPGKSS